ncbi:MAG TPA: aldehyde dehydrogenase family protein [Solirubrobacterales bacterium]|nr:aldehyde dehydrogenase family protein [Solirubrobacterales bacterium]
MTGAATTGAGRRTHADPLVRQVIGGEESEAAAGERFETVNPWTQAPAAEVVLSGEEDVARAVAAARAAFDEGPWPRLGFAARGRLLHALADAIDAHAEELAMADCIDVGKPITMLREFEVPRSAVNFRVFADHARLSTAEAFPNDLGLTVYTRYEPAGVVAAIVPWNVPLMMLSWKIAPALAWGNTVVVKPAEDSPASASLLARLASEVGIPPGVINVVHGFGPDSAGQFLTESPGIDRVTFTGETGTGRAIGRAAAGNLVPVSLELGGKSAHVVCGDVDLAAAAGLAARASFMNSGQICFAGNRILVEQGAYEEFLRRFAGAAEALRVGDPADPATEVGTLSSCKHFEKVSSYLDGDAFAGGRLVAGGPGDGWAVRPTIVADVPADSPLWREEIFGPVATVAPFESEVEAIAAANDSEYGLSALVSTDSNARASRLVAALDAGLVWVNTFPFRDPRAPYGGSGSSGVGREGGTFSRDFFTEPKQVVIQP